MLEGTFQHLFYHVVFAHERCGTENDIIQISGISPVLVLFQAIPSTFLKEPTAKTISLC